LGEGSHLSSDGLIKKLMTAQNAAKLTEAIYLILTLKIFDSAIINKHPLKKM